MKLFKLASVALVLAFSVMPTLAVAPAAPPDTSATTTNFASTTVPVAIPTGPAVVSDTITVSGAGTHLFDLDMTTFITHTFAADLDITLTSPAGTVVTITTDNGGGNDNVFNGTVWDDDAGSTATDHAYTDNVLASPLVPEGALGAFIGEDPNGVWTLTVTDDAGGDTGSLDDWSLDVTTVTPVPTTNASNFPSTTVPVAITNNNTFSDTITVSGAGAYLFDLDMTTFITHTFPGDLDITLTSPAGTVVTITTDNGGTSENVFNGTVWDDDAGTPVTDHAYADNVLASPLVPEGAFGAFIGEDPNGVWTLTITDDASGDIGSLDNWSLDIETDGSPEYASTPAVGPVAMSTTINSPVTETITVSETGTADLDVTSASLTGDGEISLTSNPAPFTVVDDSGTTQAFELTCSSTVAGTFNATLEVVHNGTDSPAVYEITCGIDEPIYSSNPAVGPVAMSTTLNVPVEQMITISEAGSADLTISAINLTGDGEVSLMSNPAPFTIVDDSGTTQSFELTCSSTVAGTFNATLEVVHNGTDSPAIYPISCVVGPEDTGAPSGASPEVGVFDPALSKIGLLVPGQTGVVGEQLEWVVTVRNVGNGAGSNITITDDVDSRLQINDVDAPGATVNINGQTVSVTYATINPGESYQFSIFTTVLQGQTVNNTVCVTGTSTCTTGSAVGELPSTGESPWWRTWLPFGN